jgi:hypothetical protein
MIENKVLVLTNLIPDKEKQIAHDNTILTWLSLQEKGISVLSFLEDIFKHKELNPQDSLNTFIQTVINLKPKIIDASRDHYWRDVLENSGVMNIEHNPYPNEIFR